MVDMIFLELTCDIVDLGKVFLRDLAQRRFLHPGTEIALLLMPYRKYFFPALTSRRNLFGQLAYEDSSEYLDIPLGPLSRDPSWGDLQTLDRHPAYNPFADLRGLWQKGISFFYIYIGPGLQSCQIQALRPSAG